MWPQFKAQRASVIQPADHCAAKPSVVLAGRAGCQLSTSHLMMQLHCLQSMVICCIPLSQLVVALGQLVMQDGTASIQLQCLLKDISCSLILPSLCQNTSLMVQGLHLHVPEPDNIKLLLVDVNGN